jgi:hypothetical protein
MNMKKLILAVLTFAASTAFATTFTPIQLLNPAGSTSGQAIVSTGASSAPAWGGIGVSGIAAIAANTVLANATNASASPTAFAMPSTCASGSLQWTSGTGFVCSTALSATTLAASGITTLSNAATVSYSSALFSVSDTSGTGSSYVAWRNNGTNVWDWNNNSSTAAFCIDRYVSGTFTDRPVCLANSTGAVTLADGISTSTIGASGLITPTSTIGIKGTSTNDSAQAGSIGEYASNSTTGTSITTGTTINATSLSLTAGDWDVECSVVYAPSTGISYTSVNSGVSTTSASFTIAQGNAGMGFPANTSTSGWTTVTPVVRISQASTATVYCVANTNFTAGTMTVNGYIRARRVR